MPRDTTHDPFPMPRREEGRESGAELQSDWDVWEAALLIILGLAGVGLCVVVYVVTLFLKYLFIALFGG